MFSPTVLKVVMVTVLFAAVANTAKVIPALQRPFVSNFKHVNGGHRGSFASRSTHSRFPRSKHSVFPVNKGQFVFEPKPGSKGVPRFNPHNILSNESPGSESGRHFRSDKVTFKRTIAADKGCHGYFCKPTPAPVLEATPSADEPSPSPEEPSPSPESEANDCKVDLVPVTPYLYSASCICGSQTVQDVEYIFRPSETDKSTFEGYIQDTTVSAACRTRFEDRTSTSFSDIIDQILRSNCPAIIVTVGPCALK